MINQINNETSNYKTINLPSGALKTINLHGITHCYVAENLNLPSFLREISVIIDLTVPCEFINSEEYIKKELIEKIRKYYNQSIAFSYSSLDI